MWKVWKNACSLEECIFLALLHLHEHKIFYKENDISCYVDKMSLRDAVYATQVYFFKGPTGNKSALVLNW